MIPTISRTFPDFSMLAIPTSQSAKRNSCVPLPIVVISREMEIQRTKRTIYRVMMTLAARTLNQRSGFCGRMRADWLTNQLARIAFVSCASALGFVATAGAVPTGKSASQSILRLPMAQSANTSIKLDTGLSTSSWVDSPATASASLLLHASESLGAIANEGENLRPSPRLIAFSKPSSGSTASGRGLVPLNFLYSSGTRANSAVVGTMNRASIIDGIIMAKAGTINSALDQSGVAVSGSSDLVFGPTAKNTGFSPIPETSPVLPLLGLFSLAISFQLFAKRKAALAVGV